ncbi:MAG: DUF4136 domain-containing protein [Planctomycetota bacterium]
MLIRRLPLVVAALLLGACASVHVQPGEADRLTASAERTYAWADESVPVKVEGQEVVDPEVIERFRVAIDEELSSRGYERVRPGDAALEATLHLGVTSDTRQNDPYFAFHAWEQVERGHLVFVLADWRSGEVVWSARGRRNLRVTEVGTGHTEIYREVTDDPRNWKAETMVAAVLDELPAR